MGAIQIGFIFLCIMFSINADWVEIPQSKPFSESSPKTSGSTFLSGTKTPVNIVYNTEQVENLESFNYSSSVINKRVTPEEVSKLETNIPRKNRITIKPAKSYIMEVFSSTTQFTPLMSSVSDSVNLFTTESPSEITRKTSTTTAASIKPTVLAKTTTTSSSRKPAKSKTVVEPTKPYLPQTASNTNRNKTRGNTKLNNHSDGIEIEDAPNDDEKLENREIPDVGSFSSYAGFLPFLKSIQTTLMQRAHKSIKSKIQVLKDLRDNLLYEIDQRIQKLWYRKESASEARGYKEDYHMDFPSNEAALMTIGFLTLAVFLVKLVLKVIAAIKAKKAYYTTTTTTTTTMATMTGRKKRDLNEYDELDIDSTYRILSSIDNFPLKYGYN